MKITAWIKEGLFLVMGIKRLFSRFIGLWGGLIYGGVGEGVGQVELGLLGGFYLDLIVKSNQIIELFNYSILFFAVEEG
jgi:hypothetical protein